MSVAAYLRLSTLDQERGIQSQEKAISDYLAGHRLTDVVWYRDRLSGATTTRPAFTKLQRDIFCGKIKTVVTWRLDRLSRSLRDGVNVLADWLEKDVRVVAVS
jgi:DNA invertase Pin-like site-specific DNA recombinase